MIRRQSFDATELDASQGSQVEVGHLEHDLVRFIGSKRIYELRLESREVLGRAKL